jgi:hypothetical protein
VSAQRIGVEALKVWNRDRYGSLDVTADGVITNDAAMTFRMRGRAASMAEDPANRRINGGGTSQYVLHVIPMASSQIVTTPDRLLNWWTRLTDSSGPAEALRGASPP